MANKNQNAKTDVATLAGGFIKGFKKHYSNGSEVLTMSGGSVTETVDQTVTNLQAIIDNRAAVTTARADLHVAVAKENGTKTALLVILRAVAAFIKANFGANATALADFGLEPPKARTPMTAEQKAVAAAKRKATREARGTVSPKVKKGIKGNVAVSVVVTPQGGAAASATTAPAAAAPAATPVVKA